MRLRGSKALLGAGCCLLFCALGQRVLRAQEQADKVRVYNVDDGISAPELLTAARPEPAYAGCKPKDKDRLHAEIALIVDEKGQPQNLVFLRPTGTELDVAALRLAAAARFTPAALDGKPVPVWLSVEDELTVCKEKGKDADGDQTRTVRLATAIVQQVKALRQTITQVRFASSQPVTASDLAPKAGVPKASGTTAAPVPLITPEAEFSSHARKKKISGECMVTLVVDAQGMPQDPHVVRSIEPSLDRKALAAVMRYRFKPGIKDGLEPVPVLITIAVNFRLT